MGNYCQQNRDRNFDQRPSRIERYLGIPVQSKSDQRVLHCEPDLKMMDLDDLKNSTQINYDSDSNFTITRDALFEKLEKELSEECDSQQSQPQTTAESHSAYTMSPRNSVKSFFNEDDDKAMIDDDTFSTESVELFNQVYLNREQTSNILRNQIAKFELFTNPDYGHKIRFAHIKNLTQALQGCFQEIINMRDDVNEDKDYQLINDSSSEKIQGKFFKLKE